MPLWALFFRYAIYKLSLISLISVLSNYLHIQWCELRNTRRGEVLVRSEWLPVTRLPAGAASARCVVSVHLHAGHNLGLGRTSPPHARVELRLGEDRAWVSRPKGPSHNPTFKQVKIISQHIFKIFFIQAYFQYFFKTF